MSNNSKKQKSLFENLGVRHSAETAGINSAYIQNIQIMFPGIYLYASGHIQPEYEAQPVY